MAWIYLAESEGSLLRYRPGSGQSPIVKTIDMHKPFFSPEWKAVMSSPYPSGMTLQLCVKSFFPQWISSMEDSHARTSALRELERVWEVAEVGWLKKSLGYLASLDLNLFSWKTCQPSLFEGLEALSAEWPRWGMIVDGRLFQPESLEPFICEKDGGFLPTPTATDTKRGRNGTQGGYLTCPALALRGELPGHPTGILHPEWTELAMGYPRAWTEVTDWAMQFFRPKRGKRLKG